jgi:putative endonuclease
MLRAMWWPWRKKDGPAHLRTGEWGEQVAEKFLRRAGFRIVGRRVRFGSRQELDLVGWLGRVLVFVEVKTRASEDFGRGWASVNTAKQRQLGRAAWSYLRELSEKPEYFRFDVVEVVGQPGDEQPQVRHIENAFSMPPGFRLPW